MAQIDFTNAVLDVNGASTPMNLSKNIGFNNSATLYDANASVASNGSKSVLSQSPTKVSILYTGTFTKSGTEFYITGSTNQFQWKVSNISFSTNDTYAFVIDVETSGNT